MELPTRRDFGGTAQQIEGVVDDRLAALAERVGDWSGIAPDVVLRAAQALVSRDRAEYDARAAAMLDGLLARFDAMKARLEKDGKAFVPPGEQTPAVELLARLCLVRAQRGGDDAVALQVRAIELVVRLLDEEKADLAGLLEPTATLVLNIPEAVPVGARRRLLEAAIDREPQHAQADRWRLGLAAVLINVDRDWAKALELAQTATRSQDGETRSQAISLVGAIHTVLVSQDDPSLAALREALAFVKQHPSSTSLDAEGLALRVATMLVAQGRAEAAREALAAIGNDQGKRATILRAQALAQLGRKGEAVAAFRRASEMVSIEADGQTYWLVWTALLELVDEERRSR
ncbi:MAG: hypothetical protein ACIAQU_07105, partial [Phycisphaerales bacterium JB064]